MSKRILFILFMLPLFVSGQVISYGNKAVAVDNKVATYTPVSSVTPFSPSDLDSLVLWLKADAGVTKDGSNYVSSWADQSGNGNNATQATGSAQPLWVDNQLNGKPVLRFDKKAISGVPLNIGSGGITLFIVYKHITQDRSYGANLPFYIATTNNKDLDFSVYNQPDDYYFYTFSNGGFITNSVSYKDQWHTYEIRKELNTSLINYVDGMNVAATTVAGRTAAFTDNKYEIGYYGNNFNLKHDIAEIIIFNNALSAIQRQQVEQYLQTKYAHY